MTPQAVIGVDFDNTLVRYDELFYRAAVEQSLAPASIAHSKNAVRDFLRAADREDDWTELQGTVYGGRMLEAQVFPGVKEFFLRAKELGIPLRIVSHKTRYAIRGVQHDLHLAAQRWLEANGFYSPSSIGLSPSDVFFETTRDAKLQRIAGTGCTLFVDDLPEVLDEASFPRGVEKVLFDPESRYDRMPYRVVRTWQEAQALLS